MVSVKSVYGAAEYNPGDWQGLCWKCDIENNNEMSDDESNQDERRDNKCDNEELIISVDCLPRKQYYISRQGTFLLGDICPKYKSSLSSTYSS